MKKANSRSLMIAAVAAMLAAGSTGLAADNLAYCNAVQNNVGLIRYPLGAFGAWSNPAGEMADVMTRVPRIYPCLNNVVAKGTKEDWRASITGDPSVLKIAYRTNSPAGASTVAISVSPHVSVFKVTFPAGSKKKYLVLDFGKKNVDDWATLNKWTDRTVTQTDSRTLQATIGAPGKISTSYVIKFSAPCTGSGSINAGAISEGATSSSGVDAGLYAQFDADTVTVAVAESFKGMKEAEEFLSAEFSGFDAMHKNCQAAWKQTLDRVELEGTENSKRMAYTALYTMYVNFIDGQEGCYSGYYSKPRSLASSGYWQFIGGFQSCCWDNFRTTYPFLMLAYPEAMTDVVNTYLARYQRDGSMDGNICLFSGPTGGHRGVRFSPVLIAEAYQSGIPADYARFYAALKDNFSNSDLVPTDLYKLGHLTQPASGGKACSETLEFATSMHSMAILAKANNDPEGMRKYGAISKCYTNLWDSTNMVFRVRGADGSWGVMAYTNWTWNPNPQGLFEGTTKDWMFFVPHDPYGLIALPGQKNFVGRMVDYSLNDTWFNDNQYIAPYLLYYAGAQNEAQKILRNVWVPMFQAGVMYEGVKPNNPHSGWQTHYTGNSGWLMCSMLGLFPLQAPAGQYLISSPSLTKATIHNGGKEISIQVRDNSDSNIYVRKVKVDGNVYPCYMIPARRLAAGAKIELEMGSDPAQGLGDLYISSTDGWVLNAELASASRLKCTIEAPITEATTKVFSRTKPVKILVNGQEDKDWNYDMAMNTTTLQTTGNAEIEVLLK
jgi:predicted alpha-1,2-mannosidase